MAGLMRCRPARASATRASPDVAVGVDAEEIVAQVLPGGPGLDAAQVTPRVANWSRISISAPGRSSGRGTTTVVLSAPVRAGQGAGPADQNETGHRAGVVSDVLGQDRQSRLFRRRQSARRWRRRSARRPPAAPWRRPPWTSRERIPHREYLRPPTAGTGPRRGRGWRSGGCPSATPGRATSTKLMGTRTSRMIRSSCPAGNGVQGGRHAAFHRVLDRAPWPHRPTRPAPCPAPRSRWRTGCAPLRPRPDL